MHVREEGMKCPFFEAATFSEDAPLERIDAIIERQPLLQRLFYKEWVHLMAIDSQMDTPLKLNRRQG